MVCSGLVALPHSSPLVSSRLLSSPPLGPFLEIDFLLSALSVPFSSPPAPSASVYILDAVKLHHRHSIPLAFFIFFSLIIFPPYLFFFFSILSTSHFLHFTIDYYGVDIHHRVSFSSFQPLYPHSTLVVILPCPVTSTSILTQGTRLVRQFRLCPPR